MKKICIAMAIFVLTLTFAVQNAYAQEVEVYHNSDTRTTYYVEDSSIAYDNSNDVIFGSCSGILKREKVWTMSRLCKFKLNAVRIKGMTTDNGKAIKITQI